jgi:dTDP-4-dehydrorhamnose reductase
MRVLVFGASGMIGNAMIRVLSEKKDWQVFGTLRSEQAKRFFSPAIAERLVTGVDVENHDVLARVFGRVRPDAVINCIGLTKHHKDAANPMAAIPLNALLPHRMAELCTVAGARLVQVSTDCVFSGAKGGYTEDDRADAQDLYGKSKFLGEVDYPHAITLRTSTIGHELHSAYGLLDWFLSQGERCKGFSRAIFSGLPSIVFAQIVRDVVLARSDLHGLYHVAAHPIGKYDLLRLIAAAYGKTIEIECDQQFVIDRSLNAQRFHAATGYSAPDWPELVHAMCTFEGRLR